MIYFLQGELEFPAGWKVLHPLSFCIVVDLPYMRTQPYLDGDPSVVGLNCLVQIWVISLVSENSA